MGWLKKYWIYFLVILVLATFILYFFLRTKKTIEVNSNKKQVQTETGITNSDGTFVKTTNLSGKVLAWQAGKEALKVKLKDESIKDFVIDPTTTVVMVPAAQRKSGDEQLHILKKDDGYQWQTAFS